jgi:hypothetical protein
MGVHAMLQHQGGPIFLRVIASEARADTLTRVTDKCFLAPTLFRGNTYEPWSGPNTADDRRADRKR